MDVVSDVGSALLVVEGDVEEDVAAVGDEVTWVSKLLVVEGDVEDHVS